MVDEKYDYDDALDDLFFDIGFTYTREGNNKNNRTICWDFWRGLSQWTKEQAVYLLCGIEPHDADFEKMPDVIVKIQLKAFNDLKVEIAPPVVWLTWFNDSGMFELRNTSKELSVWYNEQLAEKELAGDLLLDNSCVPPVQQDVKGKLEKPVKKLKPLERESSEALLLIYEICDHYKVKSSSDMAATKAWNNIITNDFKSEYVATVSESNKTIELKGGSKLNKSDFLEKYRKRFE